MGAARPCSPTPGGEGEIEVRPYFELEDFGASEAVDRARELGKELEKNK